MLMLSSFMAMAAVTNFREEFIGFLFFGIVGFSIISAYIFCIAVFFLFLKLEDLKKEKYKESSVFVGVINWRYFEWFLMVSLVCSYFFSKSLINLQT